MLKPYYQDEWATIYHGDCREILPCLELMDLVLTDPPYGIFRRQDDGIMFGKPTIYSTDKTAAAWDIKPDKALLDLVLAKGKQHVVWGGNYLADALGACRGPLVWNKVTGNNSYADGEIAWSNVCGTTRIFTHQWCGAFKDSERRMRAMHPTQKPVALMKWCLGFAPEAKTVLDPFMGSGTTLRAAKDLGIKSIGIEIEEKYCEIAVKRLRQESLIGMCV